MLGCVAYAAFRVSITVWPKKPSKAHVELNLKVPVSVKVFVIKILPLGTWRDDNCLLLQKVCLLSLPQKMYFTPTQLPCAVDLVTGPEIQRCWVQEQWCQSCCGCFGDVLSSCLQVGLVMCVFVGLSEEKASSCQLRRKTVYWLFNKYHILIISGCGGHLIGEGDGDFGPMHWTPDLPK